MKRFIFLLVTALILLTGCQSPRDAHNYAVSFLTNKLSDDVIEYAKPSGDTLFSDVHEFYMHSEELDDLFKVQIKHWRNAPEYLDSYLSVKYASNADAAFLSGVVTTVGFLGDAYRMSSNFKQILNPMELSEETSFFDWYDMMYGDVYIDFFIRVDNPIEYDFQGVADTIKAYCESQLFDATVDIVWVNEYGYDLTESSLEYDYLLIDGGYYARASLTGFKNEPIEWSDTSGASPKWGTDFYVESIERAERLQSQNKSHADRVNGVGNSGTIGHDTELVEVQELIVE